jgi:hypothetical protein
MSKMATKKTTEKTEVKSKVKKTAEVKSKEIKEVKKQPVEEVKVESTKVEDLPKVEATAEKEVKQEPAGFEKKQSAGKQIREMFESVIPKLKDEQLEILTSAEKTKEVLKIRYAFLKKSTDNKDDRKVNGNARYGAKTISINDVEYWMTNDLYSRNIEVFKRWIENI